NLVRSAVVWSGLPDPGKTRIVLQQHADTSAESMALLLDCWAQMDARQRGLTAAEVIRRLYKDPSDDPPVYCATIRAAIESLVEKPNARSLGNPLRTFRRRIFQGRFIDKAGVGEQGARWVVLEAAQFKDPKKTQDSQDNHPADSADSPDFFSPHSPADWETCAV